MLLLAFALSAAVQGARTRPFTGKAAIARGPPASCLCARSEGRAAQAGTSFRPPIYSAVISDGRRLRSARVVRYGVGGRR